MSDSNKILLLCDNSNADYLSRIQASVNRVGSAAGFRTVIENAFQTGRPVKEVLSEETFAGIVLTPPCSDDRHLLLMLEERRSHSCGFRPCSIWTAAAAC